MASVRERYDDFFFVDYQVGLSRSPWQVKYHVDLSGFTCRLHYFAKYKCARINMSFGLDRHANLPGSHLSG